MSSIARGSLGWGEDPLAIAERLSAAYNELSLSGYVSSASHEFPSHVKILQQAARDLFSNEPRGSQDSRGRLKPSWKKLLTLLFHEYFHRMRRYGPFIASDPLVDALLLISDTEDLDFPSLQRKPGYCDMVNLVTRCIKDGLPSPRTSYNPEAFFQRLRLQWMSHKRIRLEVLTESLMPWSKLSIREGSLDGPVPAQNIGYIYPRLVKLAHETPPSIAIPEMRWLRAKHDGYPRSSSLTSYVAARWSPSFTPFDNAALWQAAMTFGVLEAITDLNIHSSLLLETRKDGDIVLTFKNLNVLAYHWAFALRKDQTPEKERINHSFKTIVRAYRSLTQAAQSRESDVLGGLWTRSDAEVINIICVLHIFIRQFYRPLSARHWGVLASKIIRYNNLSPCGFPAHLIYRNKMVEDGWCPFLLGSIHSAEPYLWRYMSLLQPSFRKYRDEHRECTKDGGCTIHNIDQSTYQTRHTKQECSCPIIIPSIDDVKTHLSEGHYPVMSYNENTGSLTTKNEDEGPYVAISHVWADGLGSDTESGLPTCQIKRIHGHVRKLLSGGTPSFWIDGLCIPENQHLRKMAIQKMGDTYKRAEKVLVFDESIRKFCSRDHPPEEKLVRISMSPWMQRVWTLQEALLAKELYFEFADEIVPAYTLQRAMNKDGSIFELPTIRKMVQGLPAWGILGPRRQAYDFEDIVALLAHRMTSRPSDEPLAIAGLLNVNTKKLVDVNGKTDLESRLQALFLELEPINARFLWKRYPRMEQSPGFRWAPTSLTFIGDYGECLKGAPRTLDGLDSEGNAVCSSQGITTDCVIPVLYFTDVHTVAPGKISNDDHLLIKHPPFHALYEFDNIPHRHATIRTFNAIVFRHYSQLEPLPDGTRLPAIAVNIVDCGSSRGLGAVLGEEDNVEELQIFESPIVCEFVEHVDVTHRQPDLYAARVEALRCRLIMARVTFR